MIKTLDELIAYIDTFAAEIPQIDPDTNFWMFRSKQGAFYDEFIKHRYIAIGGMPCCALCWKIIRSMNLSKPC